MLSAFLLLLHRFTTLSTLQPGILSVYESILSPGGPTLRTLHIPDCLVGSTYQEARRSFEDAVVCGFMRNDQVQLLPSDKEVTKLHPLK